MVREVLSIDNKVMSNSIIMNLFTKGLYSISYNSRFFSMIEIFAIDVIVSLLTDFSALSGYF